ncbi:MAG TPA: hypothetical protein PKA62_08925, partial [Thermoanaerobaculia bacterium]|nr:hypothetical protein [Thermoanaerobaculia bacterium]
MTSVSLFPFAETWWVYGLFVVFVVGMLALDLGVFHRKAHVVGFREAAAWSAVWVVVAMGVGTVLYFWASARFGADARLLAVPGFVPDGAARQGFLEFLAGYVSEKALSVDN